MPEKQEKIGQFEPVHAAHAIEQVVFVLKFERPLEEAQFMRVLRVAERFNRELPNKTPILGISFVVGPDSKNPPSPIPTTLKGTSFKRPGVDGGFTHELNVETDALTFRITLYSRWDAIWQEADKYFSSLIELYAEQARLLTISINYVDKFVWSGNIDKCRPSALLRAGSKYICPHVYDINELWHSHTGAFIRLDSHTRRLLNVNIDSLDENLAEGSRRVVLVTTILNDQLNQYGYEESRISPEVIVDYINQRMQDLHGFGKDVLREIINDEMCRRIALIE